MALILFKKTMYTRTIPLKKFSEKGKYTLHTIAHQTLLCILSHACSKSPEVAWELRKNKDHRKKYYSNFLGKYKVFIKSLWNINTRKLKVNCLCCKWWARNDRVPPRRYSPPQRIVPHPPHLPPAKISRKLSLRKIYHFKILQPL